MMPKGEAPFKHLGSNEQSNVKVREINPGRQQLLLTWGGKLTNLPTEESLMGGDPGNVTPFFSENQE